MTNGPARNNYGFRNQIWLADFTLGADVRHNGMRSTRDIIKYYSIEEIRAALNYLTDVIEGNVIPNKEMYYLGMNPGNYIPGRWNPGALEEIWAVKNRMNYCLKEKVRCYSTTE